MEKLIAVGTETSTDNVSLVEVSRRENSRIVKPVRKSKTSKLKERIVEVLQGNDFYSTQISNALKEKYPEYHRLLSENVFLAATALVKEGLLYSYEYTPEGSNFKYRYFSVVDPNATEE